MVSYPPAFSIIVLSLTLPKNHISAAAKKRLRLTATTLIRCRTNSCRSLSSVPAKEACVCILFDGFTLLSMIPYLALLEGMYLFLCLSVIFIIITPASDGVAKTSTSNIFISTGILGTSPIYLAAFYLHISSRLVTASRTTRRKDGFMTHAYDFLLRMYDCKERFTTFFLDVFFLAGGRVLTGHMRGTQIFTPY